MTEIFAKLWYDQVWSKVIAAILAAIIIGIFSFIFRFILRFNIILTIIISLVTLIWLSCFYLKYGYSLKLANAPYSSLIQFISLISIFAIPILFFGGLAGWNWYKNQPSGKFIILVADFDGPDQQNYRVTEKIISQLRDATKKYIDVQVKTLSETIKEHDGNELARKKGKEAKASLILWGWYGVTKSAALVTTNFVIINKPKNLPFIDIKETLIADVGEIDSFRLQEELSEKSSYLSLLCLGLIRYEANDYDSAIEIFSNGLKHKPDKAILNPSMLYFFRGNSFINKQLYRRAIDDFDKSIGLNPNLAIAYSNRGIAYVKIGEDDKAVADYEKALSINSKIYQIYNNLGLLYYRRSKYQEAISYFTKAIELNPQIAIIYNNRAVALKLLKKYDQAITE